MEKLDLSYCEKLTGALYWNFLIPRPSCGPDRTTSFIPRPNLASYLFLLSKTGDVTQLQLPANMETLDLYNCEKITGAFLVFLPRSRAAHSRKNLLFLTTPYSSPSLLSGDIGKLILPEGMQDVDMSRCSGITGKSVGFQHCSWDFRGIAAQAALPSFLLTSFHLLLHSHTGDVTQLLLPASMEKLYLNNTNVSGTLCGRGSD